MVNPNLPWAGNNFGGGMGGPYGGNVNTGMDYPGGDEDDTGNQDGDLLRQPGNTLPDAGSPKDWQAWLQKQKDQANMPHLYGDTGEVPGQPGVPKTNVHQPPQTTSGAPPDKDYDPGTEPVDQPAGSQPPGATDVSQGTDFPKNYYGGTEYSPPLMQGGVGQLWSDRGRFARELAGNPRLRDKVLRIAYNEQGSDPRGTTGIIESMMNRASVRGTNLETQARWHGGEYGGYYAMGNMGRGTDARARQILNRSLYNALAGSNVSNFATDNSSGGLARREQGTGAFRHAASINGETFFTPGYAERGYIPRWQRWATRMGSQVAAMPSWMYGSF
jgi:hypothetical protein